MVEVPKQSSKTVKSESVNPEPITPKRIMSNEMKIHHDLFKLELGYYKKEVGYNRNGPKTYESVEHVHFFHSYDSNSRKMTTSGAAGGHKHKVTMSMDSEGNLIAEVGEACDMAGRPLENGDKHTHSARYIRSDIVNVRRSNEHALKYKELSV